MQAAITTANIGGKFWRGGHNGLKICMVCHFIIVLKCYSIKISVSCKKSKTKVVPPRTTTTTTTSTDPWSGLCRRQKDIVCHIVFVFSSHVGSNRIRYGCVPVHLSSLHFSSLSHLSFAKWESDTLEREIQAVGRGDSTLTN